MEQLLFCVLYLPLHIAMYLTVSQADHTKTSYHYAAMDSTLFGQCGPVSDENHRLAVDSDVPNSAMLERTRFPRWV